MAITYINAHQVGAGTFHDVTISDSLTVDSNTLIVDEENNRVGVVTSAPRTALDVVSNYNATAFDSQLSNNQGGGNVLKFGTGTTVAGQAYFLHTDGSWDSADADDIDLGGSQLIAVALGTSPTTHGMLLRGFARLANAQIGGTPNEGLPCYASATTTEACTFTAPSGSGDFVRVVGHCVDLNGSGDALIFWNPSNDVIELA